jgi:RNA recognition motif-containing protein
MSKKLYVGNLGLGVNESDLQQIFTEYGSILSAKVIMDRDTNQSKGFGFVEMSTDDEAQAAIVALDGKDHGGRVLKVNEAKSRAIAVTASTAPMAGIANAPW